MTPPTETGIAAEFLHAIAEHCADTIITTDVRGRLTWVSRGAEAMFGFEPEELIGWPAGELIGGGREEARAVMRRLVSEGAVRNYLTTFPGRAGRRIPVSASLALLRDRDGTITGTVATLRVHEALAPPTA